VSLVFEAPWESILVELGVVLDSPGYNNRIVEVWDCDVHIEMDLMELTELHWKLGRSVAL
jgi:hypothetical protein